MGAIDASDKLANKYLSVYDLYTFHFALLGIYVILQAIRVHSLPSSVL